MTSSRELLLEIDCLLSEAVPAVSQAAGLFEKALRAEPDNVSLLDRFAAFHCQFGDPADAVALLQKSIQLAPDQGAKKYLYLGQMHAGHDALRLFERGVEVLSKDSSFRKGRSSASRARIQVAISELFMTDLCDEEDAQARCEGALAKAFQASPNDVEVLVALATYNKTIGEVEKGAEFAEQAERRLCAIDEAADRELEDENPEENPQEGRERDDVEMQDAVSDEAQVADGGEVSDDVSDEVRVKLVMTQIDLRLFAGAGRILQRLLEQDEEDLQCWYLLALLRIAEGEREQAEEAYEAACELCKHADNACWAENLKSVKERLEKL